MSDSDGEYNANFVYVIGYTGSEAKFDEEERKEIRKILCGHQGFENISFWGDQSRHRANPSNCMKERGKLAVVFIWGT